MEETQKYTKKDTEILCMCESILNWNCITIETLVRDIK